MLAVGLHLRFVDADARIGNGDFRVGEVISIEKHHDWGDESSPPIWRLDFGNMGLCGGAGNRQERGNGGERQMTVERCGGIEV